MLFRFLITVAAVFCCGGARLHRRAHSTAVAEMPDLELPEFLSQAMNQSEIFQKLKGTYDTWGGVMKAAGVGLYKIVTNWPPSGTDIFNVGKSIFSQIATMINPMLGAAFSWFCGLFNIGGAETNVMEEMAKAILDEAKKLVSKAIQEYDMNFKRKTMDGLMLTLKRGPNPRGNAKQKGDWFLGRGEALTEVIPHMFNCLMPQDFDYCKNSDRWLSVMGGNSLAFELSFLNIYVNVAASTRSYSPEMDWWTSYWMEQAGTMSTSVDAHNTHFSNWRVARVEKPAFKITSKGRYKKNYTLSWTNQGKDTAMNEALECSLPNLYGKAQSCDRNCLNAKGVAKANECVFQSRSAIQSQLDREFKPQVNQWKTIIHSYKTALLKNAA